MTDFSAMAAKAKAERDAITAATTAKENERKKARSDYVDKAVSSLESYVVPVLERAKADFAKHGIEARIVKSYEVKNYHQSADPSIKFSCFSPKRPSDGYQMEAPPAFFSSDGTSIFAGRGKESFDREPKLMSGKAEVAKSEDLVAQVLEKAVATYYEMIETHAHTLK